MITTRPRPSMPATASPLPDPACPSGCTSRVPPCTDVRFKITARRADGGCRARARCFRVRRDDGLSLIEVVISITLLGMGVAAMLTTLAVTVNASAVEHDHANAHAWLQSATDVLYGEDRADCDNPALEDQYRAVISDDAGSGGMVGNHESRQHRTRVARAVLGRQHLPVHLLRR